MQIEDVFQQAVSTVQQPMFDEGSTKSDTDTRAYGSIEMEDNVSFFTPIGLYHLKGIAKVAILTARL